MINIVNGLLLRGQEVLMARRSPTRATYPDSWSFPGGHVEPGESLQEALYRELAEEIGVQANSSRFVHRFTDPTGPKGQPVTFHCFAVQGWAGEPRLIGDEHVALRWVRLRDAPRMTGLTFAAYADLFAMLPRA